MLYIHNQIVSSRFKPFNEFFSSAEQAKNESFSYLVILIFMDFMWEPTFNWIEMLKRYCPLETSRGMFLNWKTFMHFSYSFNFYILMVYSG